ncbi:MAG TPA: GNAT family protein [Polyangiaceae bacterium]
MPRVNEWGQPIGPELPGWVPPVSPPRVALVGRFCRVEPLDVEKHGRELFEANAESPDARSFTYLPYGPFGSFDEYRDWLRASRSADDPSFYAMVTDGRAVGIASYMRIQPAAGCIEIGHLNFSRRLQKTPAATEAMYLMMKNAFELGYRRYEWKCDALNAPSRAAAERFGFVFEGIFRQAIVYKHRSRDTAWFSIIDAEWPGVERAFRSWLAPENFDTAGQQRRRLSELMAETRRTER